MFTVGGENEYRAAVKRINAAIKELNSEMELTKIRFQGQEDSYTALFTKQQQLQRMYESQNELAKTYASRLKQVQDATDRLNQRSEELNDTLNQITAAMHNTSEVSVGYDELAAEAGEAERELRAVEAQMGKNATTALELETGINKAHAEMEKLSRELEEVEPLVREAEEATDQFAHSMDEVGTNAGEMRGKTIEAIDAIAAAAAAAQLDEIFRKVLDVMKACAGEAIEFESAMAGVFKTIDATDMQELAITEGIKELATRLPATTTEIAGVAEAAGQLGIATDDILEFTEVMIKMGTSTNLTAEDAAVNLARLATILGVSSDEYERMGSSVVDLGNKFATTETEIVEMATRMAGSGDMIGLTADQLFGIAAAVSSVGIEADAGGSAMQKLFAKIQLSLSDLRQASAQMENMGISITEMNKAVEDGGLEALAEAAGASVDELEAMAEAMRETNKYAEVAGMAGVEFARLWEEDAAAGLNAFIEGLARVEESGGDALAVLDDMGLTEVRLSRAIMTLASSEGILKEALDLSAGAWEENTALADEAARRYETTESKITILNNAVGLTKQAIGEDFMTALEPAIEGLTDLSIGAAKAAEESPALATGLAGVGGALGGLTGLATVAAGIQLVSKALAIFGTAAGPVAVGVTALAGLASAVTVYHTNVTKLGKEAEDLMAVNESLLDEVERARTAFEESGIASAEKIQQVETLATKMAELSDATQKTDADKVIIRNYVEQLNELLPGLELTFDEVTEKVNLSRTAILEFAEAAAETARLEAMRERIAALTEQQVDLEVQMMLTSAQIKDAEQKYAEASAKVDEFTEGQTHLQKALNYTNPAFLELKEAADQAKNEVEKLKDNNLELQGALQSVEGELENTKAVYDEYQNKLTETADVAKAAGKEAAGGFAEGAAAGATDISAAGESIGKNFAEGIKLGIQSKQDEVMKSARTIAETADLASREVLQIESPSKVAKKTFGYYGEGAVLGLKEKLAAIKAAANELAEPLSDTGELTIAIARGGEILRRTHAAPEEEYREDMYTGTGRRGREESGSVVNNINVTIDAKNVKEWNDVIRTIEEEKQNIRMGYTGR